MQFDCLIGLKHFYGSEGAAREVRVDEGVRGAGGVLAGVWQFGRFTTPKGPVKHFFFTTSFYHSNQILIDEFLKGGIWIYPPDN